MPVLMDNPKTAIIHEKHERHEIKQEVVLVH